MIRPVLHGLLLAALAIAPTMAQPLRSQVVPPDVGVVIPPRGQTAPVPPRRAAAPTAEPAPAPLPPAIVAPTALSLVPAMMLPLAAGVLLGGGLPGSNGSAAPATTVR
jgi:hypothetical protein